VNGVPPAANDLEQSDPPGDQSGVPGEPEGEALSTPLRERPDAPLGTLIFRAGLLPAETIESALEEGVKTGKRLGEILTERGLLKEADLARLLAGQKGLEFVTLREQIVDLAAAALFSEDQARLFRALPYAFEGGAPVVAIADPTDEVLTRNICEAIGRSDAKFVVCVRSELAEIIGQVYSQGLAPAAPPPPVPPAQEPAALPEPTPAPEPIAEAPAPEPVADVPVFEHVAEAPAPQPVTDAPAPEPVADIEAVPEVPHQNGSGSLDHVEMPPAPPAPAPTTQIATPRPESLPVAEPVPTAEPLPAPVELTQPALQVPAHEPVPAAPPEPEPAPEPVVPVQSEAPEAVSAPPAAASEPVLVPETPAVQEPSPYRLSVRLTNGERVEAGSHADLEAAKQHAKSLMAQVAAADGGDWPFVNGRFIKPDTIVSVDIV
jgi:hypothetical protein